MGHATIQMTFDRYGHLMPGSRDQARARMDAYLASSSLRPASPTPVDKDGEVDCYKKFAQFA